MDFKAPTMFGDEILAHPQPQAQKQQPRRSEILEDCAQTLATSLGDGMEDVSFREFADLVLAVLRKELSEALFLVEEDTSNRTSSVLRKVYFSSLNALHKIEDPPTRDDPPTNMTKNSSMVFPEDEYDETLCKQPSEVSSNKISGGDRPGLIESNSRASTTTASSWTSISASGILEQTSPEFISGSFHFVSEFDDDEEEENLDDYYHRERIVATAAAGNYCNGFGTSYSEDGEGKSMAVCLETAKQEGVLPTNTNIHKPTASTEHRIEIPHDFEVVTIVNLPSNRGRTYSVTTTTSVGSKTSAAAETAKDATKSSQKPMTLRGRSRSSGVASVASTLSSTIRKIKGCDRKAQHLSKCIARKGQLTQKIPLPVISCVANSVYNTLDAKL